MGRFFNQEVMNLPKIPVKLEQLRKAYNASLHSAENNQESTLLTHGGNEKESNPDVLPPPDIQAADKPRPSGRNGEVAVSQAGNNPRVRRKYHRRKG